MVDTQCVKSVIIPLDNLDVIAERPAILVALLRRININGCQYIDVTSETLAKECGYANRSGAWKQLNKLEQAGLITRVGRGLIYLNLDMIV